MTRCCSGSLTVQQQQVIVVAVVIIIIITLRVDAVVTFGHRRSQSRLAAQPSGRGRLMVPKGKEGNPRCSWRRGRDAANRLLHRHLLPPVRSRGVPPSPPPPPRRITPRRRGTPPAARTNNRPPRPLCSSTTTATALAAVKQRPSSAATTGVCRPRPPPPQRGRWRASLRRVVVSGAPAGLTCRLLELGAPGQAALEAAHGIGDVVRRFKRRPARGRRGGSCRRRGRGGGGGSHRVEQPRVGDEEQEQCQ